MELKVQKREAYGKNLKLLRKQSLIPGIVYGKHMKSSVQVVFDKNEFIKLYKNAGSSSVVDLVGDHKDMVLIYDFQVDTVTNNLLHADFLAVKANEVVSAQVPVVVTGESPLVKVNEGRVELVRDNIQVTALPKDLPREIVIDISEITSLDHGVFVRDLSLGDKVQIDADPDLSIVVAVPVQAIEEEEVVTPEATEEGVAAENEAPAAE